jgi:hypothetical protein
VDLEYLELQLNDFRLPLDLTEQLHLEDIKQHWPQLQQLLLGLASEMELMEQL